MSNLTSLLRVGTISRFLLVLLVIAVLAVIASGYVKAPPDRAYIISGWGKPKILIGRSGIKIPYLERKDELIIKQISIDIKTNGYIPTLDFIGVNIDAIAKVQIMTDEEEGIQLAMKNFLNMSEKQIVEALTDSLQGNMREIIGTQKLKDLCTDRKKFGDEVQEKAQQDMNRLGIRIISCNIQQIEDEKGLIVALGQDNMSQIQKDASIAKAQAERDVAIAEAESRKAANDAKVMAETEIAKKNTELEIQRSELKKQSDTKKAEADAAYEIQKQEQQKTIQITTVNAQIAKAEREAELKQREVAIRQQSLEAEINKKADAERYAIEQAAAADLSKRQREAEAKKYELEKAAEVQRTQAEAEKYKKAQEAEALKIQAEADKFAMEQKAAGIRAQGEAEAAAIQAKGVAEAEAMEKKAEAMKKYGQAAMMEMVVSALPEMAKAIAEPLAAIDKVTIIDSGNGDGGVSSMGGYVPGVLAKTIEAVRETTGVDITEIMKAETYDAKVTRNVNLTGLDENRSIFSDVLDKKDKAPDAEA